MAQRSHPNQNGCFLHPVSRKVNQVQSQRIWILILFLSFPLYLFVLKKSFKTKKKKEKKKRTYSSLSVPISLQNKKEIT